MPGAQDGLRVSASHRLGVARRRNSCQDSRTILCVMASYHFDALPWPGAPGAPRAPRRAKPRALAAAHTIKAALEAAAQAQDARAPPLVEGAARVHSAGTAAAQGERGRGGGAVRARVAGARAGQPAVLRAAAAALPGADARARVQPGRRRAGGRAEGARRRATPSSPPEGSARGREGPGERAHCAARRSRSWRLSAPRGHPAAPPAPAPRRRPAARAPAGRRRLTAGRRRAGQVLTIFRAAPELCDLLAGVEAGYAAFLAHPGRRPEGPHAELLPFLADQAAEWEAAAAARCAGAPAPAVRPARRTPRTPCTRPPACPTYARARRLLRVQPCRVLVWRRGGCLAACRAQASARAAAAGAQAGARRGAARASEVPAAARDVVRVLLCVSAH